MYIGKYFLYLAVMRVTGRAALRGTWTLASGWLVGCFLINVNLAIFQPYLDLEAGDNQSLKIQVARRGIEPRSSCSASQELIHSATAAPTGVRNYEGPSSACAVPVKATPYSPVASVTVYCRKKKQSIGSHICVIL